MGVTVGAAVGEAVGAEVAVGEAGGCVAFGVAEPPEPPEPPERGPPPTPCGAAASNWYRLYSRISAMRFAPYSGSVA